jgi:hypothetical protein
MPEQLMVKCKGCYTPFPVPDQMDRATFEATQLPLTSYRCPNCRIRRPYDKGDYFFGSDDPGPSPLDELLGRG